MYTLPEQELVYKENRRKKVYMLNPQIGRTQSGHVKKQLILVILDSKKTIWDKMSKSEFLNKNISNFV